MYKLNVINSPLFSFPSLSLTLGIASPLPGFFPLVVIIDHLPLVPDKANPRGRWKHADTRQNKF